MIDTSDGQVWSYRENERFPMASTFKAVACGALLDAGEKALSTKVTIEKKDLLEYAPATKKRVGQKIAAGELCQETLRTSDNTAANKVLEVLGGPQAVTAFLRKIGDTTTRLDRNEPELNEAKPGDERDTTTPAVMANTLKTLLLGNALPPADRAQLKDWLIANEVGGPLLRAGVPASWIIADRTGAGGFGTRGVIAVMWPPKREPIVAAVYLTGTKASMDDRNRAIAEIGQAIAEAVSQR